MLMDALMNPGPLKDIVLYDQEKHVSSAVWDGQVKIFSTLTDNILHVCLIRALTTALWKLCQRLYGFALET